MPAPHYFASLLNRQADALRDRRSDYGTREEPRGRRVTFERYDRLDFDGRRQPPLLYAPYTRPVSSLIYTAKNTAAIADCQKAGSTKVS